MADGRKETNVDDGDSPDAKIGTKHESMTADEFDAPQLMTGRGVKVNMVDVTGLKRGRKPKFSKNPAYLARIGMLYAGGATDQEVANFLGIHTRTLYKWKSEFEEFRQVAKVGAAAAVERVEAALYQRAVGYEQPTIVIHPETKDRHMTVTAHMEAIPADVTAIKVWLEAHKPDKYRPKSQVEHTGPNGKPLMISYMPMSEDDINAA